MRIFHPYARKLAQLNRRGLREPAEGRPDLIAMPTYRAVYLNDDGEEEYQDIAADSEGDAIRQAKKMNVPVVLERDGRVIAELEP